MPGADRRAAAARPCAGGVRGAEGDRERPHRGRARRRRRICARSPKPRACRSPSSPSADNIADSVYAAAAGQRGADRRHHRRRRRENRDHAARDRPRVRVPRLTPRHPRGRALPARDAGGPPRGHRRGNGRAAPRSRRVGGSIRSVGAAADRAARRTGPPPRGRHRPLPAQPAEGRGDAARRGSPRRDARPLRGNVSVRHLLALHRRLRRERTPDFAARAGREPVRDQGLHDTRRRRALPDRAPRRDRRVPPQARQRVRHLHRVARAAPAGSMPSSRAQPSSSRARKRSRSRSSTVSTSSKRSPSAWVTDSTESPSQIFRRSPRMSPASSPSTRSSRAGRRRRPA